MIKPTHPGRPGFAAVAGIDFEAELNPSQLAAATAGSGPSLIIAGAGSGKTRTLIYRLAHLVRTGTRPWQILLLTFTNKAAREMLSRAGDLFGHSLRGLWGGTFHSVGLRILRRHAGLLGYDQGFSILDRDDSERFLKSVYEVEGVDAKDKLFPKPGVMVDILGLAANTGMSLESVLARHFPKFGVFTERIGRIQGRYQSRKLAANVMDFDDLLARSCELLDSSAAVADEFRNRFLHILVDEYQDTNRLQSHFIHALGSEKTSLMVVGDDAQSIYSWRGADFHNILHFPETHPGASLHKIETNYRSNPEILDVANAVICHNRKQFPKQLLAARPSSGRLPALVECPDTGIQAEFVAGEIHRLIGGGLSPSGIAVLYRAHFHSMELQMALTRLGVPFQITSGLRFFEQAHIKDATSYLRFAVNPRDEVAFKRVVLMQPGLGDRSADRLWRVVEERLGSGRSDFRLLLEGLPVPPKARKAWDQVVYTIEEIVPGGKPAPPAAMLHSVIEAVYDDYLVAKFTNYDSRRDDLSTLGGFAAQFESAGEFLSELALLTGLDAEATGSSPGGDQITLSSIHQAKGLEWEVVFVIGMAEGMFPSHRSFDDEDAMEEERRLFYVACTRAKDRLALVFPRFRPQGGYGESFLDPSRFLGEIPAHLLEHCEME